jgi:23S rRNA (pseudouridine1915-N3)-methyltransferase
MRITIAAVGRLKAGPEQALAERFRARLAWPVAVREVDERRKLPAPALRRREGELLLGACPAGSVVVALDETGEALSSRRFAERIGAWQDQGAGELVFLIGGADGLDRAVLDRAALVLSLGPMTWPHLLVRGLLLEQLYRAQQILAGHPYHRD